MKKLVAFVLVLLMMVPLMAFPAAAATISPDISWYSASKTEFTLTTARQLYGWSALASTNNFSGKTIKLGADITVNTTDASAWGAKAPDYSWTPIRSFAGTFDGQGYTISGLYAKGSSGIAFIASCTEAAVVKNLSLVNSYFETGGSSAGGVCAAGGGLFQNLYSDAIVVCGDHHAGGIFGVSGSKTVVEDSWFDGEVRIAKRYAAGIVGNGNGQTVEIRHCLNTGAISTTHDGGNAHIAGMCGRNDAWTVIEDCLNLGKISSPLTEAGKEDQLGSIFGQCSSNNKTDDGSAWKSHTSLINCWACAESAIKTNAALSSTDPSQVYDVHVLGEGSLKGYGGYLNTTLDFENHWCVDVDGYPRLRALTPADEIPPLYDVEIPALSDGQLKLEGRYGTRWTLTVQIPEGMTKDDVAVGALVVPTEAIPAGVTPTLLDTSYTYKGRVYEVAKVEGRHVKVEGDKIVATFLLTDFSQSNVLKDFTCVPYAIFTPDGASIDVYGEAETFSFYQEAALSYEGGDEEHKANVDAALMKFDRKLGGRLPVSRDWMDKEEFEGVPAMLVNGATVTKATDYGDGAWVITLKGAKADDYNAYLEVLEQFGYEKVYANNSAEGGGIDGAVFNTTFQKDNLTLTVVDITRTNTVYVTAKYDQKLSPHLYDTFSDDVAEGAVTKMHVNEMIYWGNSILFQLKNGHFILNDGATDYELPYLLDYLESLVPEGEIPVIEAWFISHMHYDHDCVFRPMATHPEWIDRVRINGVYVSEPSNAVKDLDSGVYNEIAGVKAALALMKTEDGGTPQWYRVQTGQKYYFSDITVEIMMAQEQILLSNYKGGFNDSSTWLRYMVEGQDIIIAGDSHQGGMNMMMNAYTSSTLNFDIFFTLHHGSNTWTNFTSACTYKTVIHPSTSLPSSMANSLLGAKAKLNGGEVLVEGGGTLVLTFPYKVGQSVKLPGNQWIYNDGNRVG